jgi:antitoxin HicB
MNLESLLEQEFALMITPDTQSGGYVAHFPDLPGCVTVGESLEEVVAMANDAKNAWITAVHKAGKTVPQPKQNYSGQFRLRLPKSLHRQLAITAEQDGVSLNSLASVFIAQGLSLRSVEKPSKRV